MMIITVSLKTSGGVYFLGHRRRYRPRWLCDDTDDNDDDDDDDDDKCDEFSQEPRITVRLVKIKT